MRLRLDRTIATVPPTTIAKAMAAKIAYDSRAGKPKIVLPEGPPPVAACGFTVSVTVAVVLRPAASVTVTRTVKSPGEVGVQEREATFAEPHP